MILKKAFYSLLFLLLGLSFTSFCQLTETYEIQDFSPEVLSKNHIRIITGWEYHSSEKNSKITLKTKQSYRLFDRGGRLIEEIFYWEYSDIGHLNKKFNYDTLGRLKKMTQAFGDSIELVEYYEYDSLHRVAAWKVDFTEGGDEFDFTKYINYDHHGNPVSQRIQLKDRERNDTIKNYYEGDDLVLSLKLSDTSSVADSIVYQRNLGDTLWKKSYYEGGTIIYKQTLIQDKESRVYRTINYKDGKLLKINYHRYHMNGNILQNRTFHHYVQGNFKKIYTYDEKGLPKTKVVYKNKEDPETIVKYEFGYY